MPRGAKWSKAESISLVEAYVHISEDAAVGVNQTSDTLFQRVTLEAKKRFGGDWSRLPTASKSRWAIVSKHVSKFIAADLLVNSVQHSGWGEEDYYKATVKAYNKMMNKSTVNLTEDSETYGNLAPFQFKEEWEILRDHQKWQSSISKQEREKKRKMSSSSSPATDISSISAEEDEEDSTKTGTSGDKKPAMGVKKAKAIKSLELKASDLIHELKAGRIESEKNRHNYYRKWLRT